VGGGESGKEKKRGGGGRFTEKVPLPPIAHSYDYIVNQKKGGGKGGKRGEKHPSSVRSHTLIHQSGTEKKKKKNRTERQR